MDQYGYILISDLINKTDITYTELDEIVRTDDKQRYSYNDESHLKLKANQGHSIDIVHNFKKYIPSTYGTYLFHGSSIENKDAIMNNGLLKMNRHHVHLHFDPGMAVSVGTRKGKPCVFQININQMIQDNPGLNIYISDNNVILIDHVKPKYLSIVNNDLLFKTHCAGVIVFNPSFTHVALVKNHMWGFPKGKKENKETSLQTAIRECYEESSLCYINDCKREHGVANYYIPDLSKILLEISPKTNKPSGKYFIGILCNDTLPNIKPSPGFENELAEVKWFHINDAIPLLNFKERNKILTQAYELIKLT